jgi:hypothetical protein
MFKVRRVSDTRPSADGHAPGSVASSLNGTTGGSSATPRTWRSAAG